MWFKLTGFVHGLALGRELANIERCSVRGSKVFRVLCGDGESILVYQNNCGMAKISALTSVNDCTRVPSD